MVYNLAALHDVNTGVILTTLVISFLKCRGTRHAGLGALVMVVFILSVLPTPIHGTGIWGIAALLTTYAYLYRIWDPEQETTQLVLTAILFMMLNIALGFKLRGIF